MQPSGAVIVVDSVEYYVMLYIHVERCRSDEGAAPTATRAAHRAASQRGRPQTAGAARAETGRRHLHLRANDHRSVRLDVLEKSEVTVATAYIKSGKLYVGYMDATLGKQRCERAP